MEEFILVIAVVWILIWFLGVYGDRHPLEPKEVHRLAKVRQRNLGLSKYQFSQQQRRVNAKQKKAMRAGGEFVQCDLDYKTAPAWVAAMLKYKKHEWVVIGFICSFRVKALWWNKGPNRNKVRPFLSGYALDSAIDSLNPDAIAILHNHPNPNPGMYVMNRPSQQDLRSAEYFKNQVVSKNNVSLLEFVCERGVPHLYFAAFPDREIPIQPITEQIQAVNGTSYACQQ